MQTLETTPYEAICAISLNPLDTRKPRGHKTKNSMCFCCGTRLRLSDHHLKPRSEGGTDQPDNLVTVCFDCHDEIEGPADGAWERVVQFKNKIKDGRIAKTKQQRALDLREGKTREAEYEKTLRDNKNRILQAWGVVQDESVAVPGLPQLRAKRRAQGFLDRADGRLYYSLTHGDEAARLLFDAPLEEYVQSISARVAA
jgi:hypothetical protein